MKTTVTDLGAPGAENYFANSREEYFAHTQQQRQASLVALLHLLLCGSVLQGFEDKGLDFTNSQQEDSKGKQHFLLQGPALTVEPLISIFMGVC